MKVKIDRLDREGWKYFTVKEPDADGCRQVDMKSPPFSSYPIACAAARAAGHEIDNAGWNHKLLMWQFNGHAIDGYPTWEQETTPDGTHPAFIKLEHVNKRGPSSNDLCREWDDLAEVDLYQRDWSHDGSIFVDDGETYSSGWWFATLADRDRFAAWVKGKHDAIRRVLDEGKR